MAFIFTKYPVSGNRSFGKRRYFGFKRTDMPKTLLSILFLLLFYSGIAQSSKLPFTSMTSGKWENVDIGGLYYIDLGYQFSIDKEGFSLDTVKVRENQFTGYSLEILSYFNNKISTSQYDYSVTIDFTKQHLGSRFFNEIFHIKGSVYLEGESADNFSVTHEFLEIETVSESFVIMQYLFAIHYCLLLASALVLLILKTPLNLRHGLIVAIPLLGPVVYLTKETIRLIRARKKKGNKRKEQSKPHPQSATHALES